MDVVVIKSEGYNVAFLSLHVKKWGLRRWKVEELKSGG